MVPELSIPHSSCYLAWVEFSLNFRFLALDSVESLTIVSSCAQLQDKQDRKAAFKVAWMKLLEIFHTRKPSRSDEPQFLVLVLVGQQFHSKVLRTVINAVQELIYTCKHWHKKGGKRCHTTFHTQTSRDIVQIL